MLTADIRNNLLVDELQLGTVLNKAVHNSERAYFNLLLSMLSPDVTDSATNVDAVKSQEKTDDLYRQLGILKGRGDYAEVDDYPRAGTNADLIDSGLQASLELSLCLYGEPLAPIRSDLPSEVMANLSPLERQKTENAFEGKNLSHVPCDLRTLDIVNTIDASRNAISSI